MTKRGGEGGAERSRGRRKRREGQRRPTSPRAVTAPPGVVPIHLVMAGLVPAIHVCRVALFCCLEVVDARPKAGHDEKEAVRAAKKASRAAQRGYEGGAERLRGRRKRLEGETAIVPPAPSQSGRASSPYTSSWPGLSRPSTTWPIAVLPLVTSREYQARSAPDAVAASAVAREGMLQAFSPSWQSGAMSESGPHEVYFEFTAVGHAVRVAAVCARTGLEVVVMGPVSASQRDLERLALRKLESRRAAGAT
jgi:hypothetical protein